MRKDVDVSVVLNLHRESVYLRPTLFSLDACAKDAARNGLNVELVAVFDRSDQETIDLFDATPLHGFSSVKTVEVDVGSLGLARNAGIELAEGEFIWTADGDDLVSRNAIVALVGQARKNPERNLAIFVEYWIDFGNHFCVGRYLGSEWYTAADFAYHHPFVSRVFIKRNAFDVYRYSDLKVAKGFAYEDWDFNNRLYADGFEFQIASEAVVFYRKRNNSLLQQANSTSSRIAPHSKIFEPGEYISLMDAARNRNPSWVDFLDRRKKISERNNALEFFSSEKLLGYVMDAAVLDPEVDPVRIELSGSYSPMPRDERHWGYWLESFYRMLGGRSGFTDVILLPRLNPSESVGYIVSIVAGIKEINPESNILVLSGDAATEHKWVNKLPVGSEFLDVFNAFPMISEADRDMLMVRGLLAVSKDRARLHTEFSSFSSRMIGAYGDVLASRFFVVIYRFCDEFFVWRNNWLASSSWLRFLRASFGEIDLIVASCEKLSHVDELFLGASKKSKKIYSLCDTRDPAKIPAVARNRLLWASRISDQKRPNLVRRIALSLRERISDVVIDVYGQCDAGCCADSLFSVPGVEYKGGYDDLDEIPFDLYDGLIYTSAFDGLPDTVVKAMSVGLPVIAPNVGGISEAIVHGETGFLLPDHIDEDVLVGAYVEAVCSLYGDISMVMDMAENGRKLIEARHSASIFLARVADVFFLKENCNG